MLANKKMVSVIMATYNTKKEYLMESINSLLNQTYQNMEIIIICDGSEEEYNFLKELYKNETKIKLFLNPENKGLPYSLNKAIEISTGEYIARMDSDDICFINRIKKQVKFMEKNKNIVVSGMFARVFGDKKRLRRLFFHNPYQIEIQSLYMSCLIHPSVMIRKEYLEKNSIRYNEEFLCSQDFELWSRISKDKNIAVIPRLGIYYRCHEQQASNAKLALQEKFSKIILHKNAQKISKDNSDEIEKCLLLLSGREKVTIENYKAFSNYLNKLIENNGRFKKSVFEKILYNRFFHMLISSKTLTLKNIYLLKDKEIRKKVLRIYNLRFLLFLIINRI